MQRTLAAHGHALRTNDVHLPVCKTTYESVGQARPVFGDDLEVYSGSIRIDRAQPPQEIPPYEEPHEEGPRNANGLLIRLRNFLNREYPRTDFAEDFTE